MNARLPYHQPYEHDMLLHSSNGFVSGAAYALGEANKDVNALDWHRLQRRHHNEQQRAKHDQTDANTRLSVTRTIASSLVAETRHLTDFLQLNALELEKREQTLVKIKQQIAQLTSENYRLKQVADVKKFG